MPETTIKLDDRMAYEVEEALRDRVRAIIETDDKMPGAWGCELARREMLTVAVRLRDLADRLRNGRDATCSFPNETSDV